LLQTTRAEARQGEDKGRSAKMKSQSSHFSPYLLPLNA
jgi:hypothetical protein